MAREVIERITCDICGSDQQTGTLELGWEGDLFEIDVCQQHDTELRDAIGKVAEKGRRKQLPSFRTARARASARRQVEQGPSAREMREWARANGMEVPEKGRIPAEVRQAYEAANPQ